MADSGRPACGLCDGARRAALVRLPAHGLTVARTHPRAIVFTKSRAERQVFDLLERALPHSYDVLHHVRWVQRRRSSGGRDGETDFLIVHPERGILVMEVKGGRVRYEAVSGRWFSRPAGGDRDLPIKDPFQQATDAKYDLRRWLQDVPGWQREWGPFGHAVAFPDGLFRDAPLPNMDPRLVIDAGDIATDARLRAKIEETYEFWKDGRRLGLAGARRVVDALAHDLEIRQPLGLAVDEADRNILRLSDVQFGILRTLAGARRVAISGPAGSGKTLLAAEKAKRLAADGFRTLLTCFNRPLADYLRASLAGIERLDVLSYHQLSRQLAGEAELLLPRASTWTQREWDQVAALLELAGQHLGPRYDALVVDEAQDFHDDWWLPLLTLLYEPDHGVLYVFFDSNQAIYGTPRGMPDGLMPVPLWENWRNTREIFQTVLRFYRGDPIESRGPIGPAVEWRQVADSDLRRELGRVLHRLVREASIGSREVVVLTPIALERSAITGRCGTFLLTPRPRGRDDVQISTIHRFKGLDAKAVIVCEVSSREDATFLQLMYVACSRARSMLVVLETQ